MFKPAQLVHRCAGATKRLPWAAVGLGLVLLIVALEATFIVQARPRRAAARATCRPPRTPRWQEVPTGSAVPRLPPHEQAARGSSSAPEGRTESRHSARSLRRARSLPGVRLPSGICVTCHQGADRRRRVPPAPTYRCVTRTSSTPACPANSVTLGRRTASRGCRPYLDHGSCSACHDGITAGIACSVCHRRDPPETRPGSRGARHCCTVQTEPGCTAWADSIVASRATRARSAHPVTASSFPTT